MSARQVYMHTPVSTLCDETAIEDRALTCFVRETGCILKITLCYLSLFSPLTFSKTCTFVIRLCYPALLLRGILMLIYDEDLQICRTRGMFLIRAIRTFAQC